MASIPKWVRMDPTDSPYPGEHVVGEKELWKATPTPPGFDMSSLDLEDGGWQQLTAGHLTKRADPTEAEIEWTAPGEQLLVFDVFPKDHSGGYGIGRHVRVKSHPSPSPAPRPGLVEPMGFPESFPDRTYVSTQGKKPFLAQAQQFHKEWGIPVSRFNSLQDLLSKLADGTGLRVIQIVAHAAHEVHDGVRVDFMTLPVFRRHADPNLSTIYPTIDGRKVTPADIVDALAQSEVQLVTVLLGYILPADTPGDGSTIADAAVRLVRDFVADGHRILEPFRGNGMDAEGNPIGVVRELVGRAIEAAALRKSRQTTGVATLLAAVRFILNERWPDSLRRQVEETYGVGLSEIRALERAIDSRIIVGSNGREGFLALGEISASGLDVLRSTVNALTRARPTISTMIERTRTVLGSCERVDIRGCRLARDINRAELLHSLRRLFDSTERLTVSAPTMDTYYPRIDVALASNERLDELHQSGCPEIDGEVDRWAFQSGVIRLVGGRDKWFDREFPNRGITLLDFGVPLPILERRANQRAWMMALTERVIEGTTRDAGERLLTAMWVLRGGARPIGTVDRILRNWERGQPPRTCMLAEREDDESDVIMKAYFQGDGFFEVHGIHDLTPPALRASHRIYFRH